MNLLAVNIASIAISLVDLPLPALFDGDEHALLLALLQFLVNRYGIPVALHSESLRLKDLEADILELLKQPSPFHPDGLESHPLAFGAEGIDEAPPPT